MTIKGNRAGIKEMKATKKLRKNWAKLEMKDFRATRMKEKKERKETKERKPVVKKSKEMEPLSQPFE
jgi:NAD+--asparagine ADP-ribosyltransferase